MNYELNAAVTLRMDQYFSQLGAVLKNDAQRASFATYALGILGEGERKSVEPIAARACPDPARVDALHQRLLHFVGPAPWSDAQVRLTATRYAVAAMTEQGPVTASILDDTGFLKQGTHSVGVQRQYTGSAGKIANCQLGVSLTLATATAHCLADMELYLPRSWTEVPARRAEAHIPDDLVFQTKPELALGMLRRAQQEGLPLGTVLADSGFGNLATFRTGVRQLGLPYAVGIHSDTKVHGVNDRGRVHPLTLTVKQWAKGLVPGQFRRITWRDGTQQKLWSSFVFRRVIADKDPNAEPVWLVMERLPNEAHPSKFYLCTGPRKIVKTKLVRLLKERYRTEQMYEEAKGELGLDHYEGRRYGGWHHHVSVVLACFAFVVAERVRAFPPSAAWSPQAAAYGQPAPAPLS
jgi:SRSO17 transposase